MVNHCGTCTLCCKLKGVEELAKPSHVWCHNCRTHAGCGIYPNRPRTCSEYMCLYLQMKEEQPHSSFPLSFRPDHCKFLVDTGVSKFGEVFLIWPNNSVPGVEKKPEMKSMISLLKKAAPQNTIILCHKTVRKIIYLSPSGKAVLADLGVDVP